MISDRGSSLEMVPNEGDWARKMKLTLPARAMQRLTKRPVLSCLVVIIPTLHPSMNSQRSSTFSLTEASVSRFFALTGSAGLEPVSVVEKPPVVPLVMLDMLNRVSENDLIIRTGCDLLWMDNR